jgi:hypothetical protein
VYSRYGGAVATVNDTSGSPLLSGVDSGGAPPTHGRRQLHAHHAHIRLDEVRNGTCVTV